MTEEEIKAAFVTAFNKLVTERAGASCACPALAHPCASVAEFDERLWGAMVDYVTVGVDKRLTVVFRDGMEVEHKETVSLTY
ncbi:hypothetical protein [Anaerovibrio lipolyticus]|uniref:hypothetical protein n=1 Tax=Anaerovibrio lipolyticus TaxID=82374 RepID=UPI0026E9CBFD|nr:hypothetical protein [Anaerovibrio lipolyticus]